MYREVLQALAGALGTVTDVKQVIKGRPLLGQGAFKPPGVALLCDSFPEPPTRNGAVAGTGALGWTVTVFGADEAAGLALMESVLTWLHGKPSLTVESRRVNVQRNGVGERQPNEQDLTELEHAFSVPITTTW